MTYTDGTHYIRRRDGLELDWHRAQTQQRGDCRGTKCGLVFFVPGEWDAASVRNGDPKPKRVKATSVDMIRVVDGTIVQRAPQS